MNKLRVGFKERINLKKYVEVGYGNKWFIRTEIEYPDGTEIEVKGIDKPIKLQSIYLRVWLGYKVFILDLKSGLQVQTKTRKCTKFILGFSGI